MRMAWLNCFAAAFCLMASLFCFVRGNITFGIIDLLLSVLNAWIVYLDRRRRGY